MRAALQTAALNHADWIFSGHVRAAAVPSVQDKAPASIDRFSPKYPDLPRSLDVKSSGEKFDLTPYADFLTRDLREFPEKDAIGRENIKDSLSRLVSRNESKAMRAGALTIEGDQSLFDESKWPRGEIEKWVGERIADADLLVAQGDVQSVEEAFRIYELALHLPGLRAALARLWTLSDGGRVEVFETKSEYGYKGVLLDVTSYILRTAFWHSVNFPTPQDQRWLRKELLDVEARFLFFEELGKKLTCLPLPESKPNPYPAISSDAGWNGEQRIFPSTGGIGPALNLDSQGTQPFFVGNSRRLQAAAETMPESPHTIVVYAEPRMGKSSVLYSLSENWRKRTGGPSEVSIMTGYGTIELSGFLWTILDPIVEALKRSGNPGEAQRFESWASFPEQCPYYDTRDWNGLFTEMAATMKKCGLGVPLIILDEMDKLLGLFHSTRLSRGQTALVNEDAQSLHAALLRQTVLPAVVCYPVASTAKAELLPKLEALTRETAATVVEFLPETPASIREYVDAWMKGTAYEMTDDAVQALFEASEGFPYSINLILAWLPLDRNPIDRVSIARGVLALERESRKESVETYKSYPLNRVYVSELDEVALKDI